MNNFITSLVFCFFLLNRYSRAFSTAFHHFPNGYRSAPRARQVTWHLSKSTTTQSQSTLSLSSNKGEILEELPSQCELATEGTVQCSVADTDVSPPTTTSTSPSPPSSVSVWTYFGELAAKTGASNLGQGFPDWNPPKFLLDALHETVSTPFHQYTRPAGHPPLVELLGGRYSRHLQRKIDPYNEVAITVGASQALYLALLTFMKPGDEVVILEPFFDLYLKQIKLLGGVPKYVALGGKAATLKDPWALDINTLKSAITKETKFLILNSPHNPTGKVFTRQELEAVAQIVRENPNLIVLSDEVYKFSVYNPLEEGDETSRGHYHFARLPDMWDRTITISSCGKTFSVTGWQVGWTVGPAKYIRPIQDILPCVQFCASTPIQNALTSALQVAEGPFEGKANYYEWLRSQFQSKRKILEDGLREAGIEPLESHGGFFLMGRLPMHEDVLEASRTSLQPYDWLFCTKLAKDYGVIGIPASPFFSSKESADKAGPMARFAFCKKDETLILAANRLRMGAMKRKESGQR